MIICLLLLAVSLISLAPSHSLAKREATVVACKASALRALKHIPKLRYKCRAGVEESDEAILRWPARIQALRILKNKLALLSDNAWWQAEVDDLNVCEFKRRAGALNDEESQKFKDDYTLRLLGNHQVRLAIVYDPCYQTEWSGSIVFLLSKGAGAVSVTKVLDGYFSRIENSIGFDFANLEGQQIIEVRTGNDMPPSQINYYFAVDQKTNRVLPRKMFQNGSTLTNEISSDMLLSDPEDLELPEDAGELKIIRDHKLAPTFSTYTDDPDGKIDVNGRKLSRTIYRWNGRVYSPKK